MATVEITKVIENYPEIGYGQEPHTTIDLLVDGKRVRMAYPTSKLKSANDVKSLILADADIIKSGYKQQDSAFSSPTGKADRTDLNPGTFTVS